MDALQFLLPARGTATAFDVLLLDKLSAQVRPAFEFILSIVGPRSIFARGPHAQTTRDRAWLLASLYLQHQCLRNNGEDGERRRGEGCSRRRRLAWTIARRSVVCLSHSVVHLLILQDVRLKKCCTVGGGCLLRLQ
jgi:hypothetical protein